MARWLCFILLILFSVSSRGANDSLLVKGISRASMMAIHNQNDSAIALADSILFFAEQRKSPVAQAALHFILGTCYSNKKEQMTAIKEFMTVMVIADQENFNKKADKNLAIYNVMLNTFLQTAELTMELGWKEQSVSCAKAGVSWAMKNPNNELTIKSMAVLGNILTMYQEYDYVYEPMKQAYTNAVKQGYTEYALGIVRGLVELEENLHHTPPNKNPWIAEGQRLMRNTKEDKVSLAFLTTTQESFIKEIARRDSIKVNAPPTTIIANPDSTQPLSVPKDSIQHHTHYVFVKNKKAIKIGIIVVVLLLITFGLYVIWQRHIRRKREIQRYIEGLEQERNRLAKELHDGVSNQLLAVEMKLNTEDGSKDQAIQILNESREQVRRVSHDLMPPEFSYTTLDEVITNYILELNGTNHCDISCYLNPPNADWSTIASHEALEIYRIVQEALSNALKHSNATTIAVGMHKTEHKTVIIVSDNGTSGGKDTTSGIGMRTMKQRAQIIGASLEFRKNKYGHVVKLTIE